MLDGSTRWSLTVKGNRTIIFARAKTTRAGNRDKSETNAVGFIRSTPRTNKLLFRASNYSVLNLFELERFISEKKKKTITDVVQLLVIFYGENLVPIWLYGGASGFRPGQTVSRRTCFPFISRSLGSNTNETYLKANSV